MSPSKNKPQPSGLAKSIDHFEHVVFLGTYNADPFRAQIEEWLPALDLTNVALFVADNHSTDNTPHWLSDLVERLKCFSVVSINERNFGGYGNLATNLHKFKSANWITTLHQDDQYSPEHIQNHRKVINSSAPNLGMVCSEAISITPEGQRMGYPRAHWLLENQSDPVTVFLAHLRNHAYPFSGATFSKDVLLNFPIPWHSTAFPDTEIVMKMSVDYSTAFASGVTVKYLENPNSESHSLAPQHRDFGAFQALFRVFAHPNYEKLCGLVPPMDIPNYLKSLDEGISQRFQDADYARLMKQAAFEITAQHVGTGPEMAGRLAEGYIRVGDVRALEILSALGAHIPTQVQTEKEKSPVSSSGLEIPKNFKNLARLSAYLPRGLRRILFKALMKTKAGRSRLASWDFDWRDS